MKRVKELGLIILVLALSGCIVLGFATDLAILSASNGNQKPGDLVYGNNAGLIFTQEGLKHDVKVVKNFIEEFTHSNKNFTPTFQADGQALTCKNVKDDQQQCYGPEYYKDMYIKVSASKVAETNSRKD